MSASLKSLVLFVVMVGVSTQSPRAQRSAPANSFVVSGDQFELNGKPFEVLSGEIHYARIPREYWRQRMQMAKAMGLNTIATYVFWNVHEPSPGVYDFTGNNNLVAFLKLAQSEGLHVLLRAGPYACAEWEFGGFPAWLLKDPRMSNALRSNDPSFMVPAERWIKRLAHEVAPLQIEYGGPIIATQIENEYGNFSNDHAYMRHMQQIFEEAGFNHSLLYTVDPSKALAKGQLEGIYSGVNFGTGRAQAALDILAQSRPGQPLFATEYWPGWFDLWGHPHETRPLAPQLADLDYMLAHHASVNIYMFHGGTNFGMMAGASASTGSYRGNVTSYDYDAPLDEAGHPTAKFFAYRDLILKHTHQPALPLPAVAPVIAIPPFALRDIGVLDAHQSRPVSSNDLLTMEQVDQAYGYILYRKQLDKPMHAAKLVLDAVHDYAQVYLDGRLAGTLDRHYNHTALTLSSARPARLDILVENTGRLNSTGAMRKEWKGLQHASLDGAPLTGWRIFALPMQGPPDGTAHSLTPDPEAVTEMRQRPMIGPHFALGRFSLAATGDTFLDVSMLGKGLIWINGHALGRFWNIGPQQTMYVPAPWLRKGVNQVIIFDLFPARTAATLIGRLAPMLNGPTPGYETDPERIKKPAADAEFGTKLAAPADTAPTPKD